MISKALHDDEWSDGNPRSISTFHTFSRGTLAAAASATTPPSDPVHHHLPLSSSSSSVSPVDGIVSQTIEEDDDHLYDAVVDDDDDQEDVEQLVSDFEIDLGAQDRRFGFSVVGGYDEGFPPRIDEITTGSPADRTDLEVGDEILEVNGKSLENASHTEVISHIHQCIKSRTICLRVKRKTGNKLALDLAQHSSVQDAFVIAVEQQARERLEKLSALQKIKPVDMTKLSQQLSQESSSSSQELSGIIEDSPIYVTSVPNLSQSTSNIKAAVVENRGLRAKGPVAGSAPNLDSGRRRRQQQQQQLAATDGPSDGRSMFAVAATEEEIELKQTLDPPPVARVAPAAAATAWTKGVVSTETPPPPPPPSHREMAVDVPDSFTGSSKAPPRYPPLKRTAAPINGGSLNSSTASSASSRDSRAAKVTAGGLPPSSKEGVIGTRAVLPRRGGECLVQETSLMGNGVPTPAPRTTVHPPPSAEAPTESQMDRIRKYQEDIRRRREEEERLQREEEFLRTSLRGSKKLQALEQNPPSPVVAGFENTAFQRDDVPDDDDDEEDDVPGQKLQPAPLKRIAGVGELIAALQRVQTQLHAGGHGGGEVLSQVDGLLREPHFQQALKIHNKVQQVCCFLIPPTPLCADARGLTQEVLSALHESTLPEAAELCDLLNRYEVEGLLLAHDKIAEREAVVAMSPDEELLDRASQYTEDSVKIVRIEKTNEPLGATVRNEGEAVVIGRIVKGGVAETSGLLHEGDEVLEVNNIEMRGKSVNEVCDILASMTGTLTFLIVPTQYERSKTLGHDTVIHVKAHFDYDPEDDLYIPCRELGISFQKGDILHIINQEDPNWWQAFREGEEDQSLAGLIPSKSFQQQREAMKQTIVGGDTNNREKSKKGILLCAKKNAKKKKKKVLYSASYNNEFDAEEILTYEEVTLYYPRANRKRPIVLIGPPNIGRHELRQKLMEDVERFAAAIPHTSRPKKDEELDGQDYYFISRQQFEADILGRKFVEHGEYEKNYYGTSLDAIRTVVNSGKICVLNLHPQSLKILKASDLKPFVVYVAPPSLEKLRQNRTKMGINAKDDELKDIIEKAREMEENYGHYFDMVIVNSDLERAYNQLLHEINVLEREPQWVPAAWLQNEIN